MKRKNRKKVQSTRKKEALARLAADLDFLLLKATWPELDPVRQAEALEIFRQRRFSNYVVGELLHLHEKTIRNYRHIANLSNDFTFEVRHGMSVAQAITKDAEKKAFWQRLELLSNQARPTCDSDKLSEEIISFFKSQGIWSGLGVDILNEAKREIFLRERQGFFDSRAPEQTEVEKLIRNTEPADDVDWGGALGNFYKPLTWLLTWACRRYPVYEILDAAFSKAISYCHAIQIKKTLSQTLSLNSGWGVDKTYLLEYYVQQDLDETRRLMSLGLGAILPKDHPIRLAAKLKAKE